MKISCAYRFRIYPNKAQQEMLARQFGASRWVYNHFLRARIDYYAEHKDDPKKKGLTYYDTSKMLTQLKREPEYVWLQEANAQSLQQALRDLDVAYNNFFNKRARFPRFKSGRSKQSFRVPQRFSIEEGKLNLPKLSPIRMVIHREIEGEIKNVTVSRTTTGKYYASLCCEREMPEPEYTGDVIGIDLGVKDFIVTSNGEHVKAPKYLRQSEKRLRRAQRELSRRQKGSKGREKARQRVALLHEKVTNQRSDFLHKLSRRLVDENQAICAESLNVAGMLHNHCLAKSIADCGWSEFLRQLGYKGAWYGCWIEQVDRFFPSSKRCSDCGFVLDSLPLSARQWACPECGSIHDRDENAAKNILDFCTVGTTGTHTPGESRVADSWNPEAPVFRREQFTLDDIPYNVAFDAHRQSSHTPDKRAEQERAGYVSYMRAVEADMRKVTDDEELLREALTRYREGYLSRKLDVLRAKAGTASSMITGPSNFPTARNQKALDSEQRKVKDLLDWQERAQRAMKRDLTPVVSREDKIANAEADRERIKAINKIARSKAEDKVAQIVAMGISEQSATQICADGGMPAYVLRNLGARIRQMKKQEEIEAKRDATPTSEVEFAGGVIVDNAEEDRVQIVFDEKPCKEVRQRLGQHGFVWSRRNGAWQRKRTERAMQDAMYLVKAGS